MKHHIIKKISAIIFSATFVATVFAGCSSNNSQPVSSAAAEKSELSVASSESTSQPTTTKIFSTVKGDIEIPVNPQKIVSDFYLGEFLALDIKPIIASDYALNNPFLSDLVSGIQPLNTTSAETSLEMITAAQPDLIVTLKEEDYDTYSKIAPTVLIPYGAYSEDELFLYIGEMLGKKEDAQKYLDTFNAKALAAKPEIQSIVGEQTVSIVEVWPKELYVMGSHFGRGGMILYDLWQLKAPEKIQKPMVDEAGVYEVVSLETLPEYAGDFIAYGVLADTDSAYLEDSNIWQGLPSVKNAKIMPYEQVAFMHSDPISLNKQLEIYIDFFRKFK